MMLEPRQKYEAIAAWFVFFCLVIGISAAVADALGYHFDLLEVLPWMDMK